MVDRNPLSLSRFDLVRRLDEHDLGLAVDNLDDRLVYGDREVLGDGLAGELKEERGFVVLEELGKGG